MVHKRYIKKGGKIYGPYLYKSIRGPDGKVKNIYLSKPEENVVQQKSNFHPEVFFILLIFLLGFFFLKTYTGFSIIQEPIQLESSSLSYTIDKNIEGETIDIFSASNGEDISPSSTTKKIEIRGVKNTPPDLKIKLSNPKEDLIKTEVIALNREIELENATVSLKTFGNVNAIYHCPDYNYNKETCDEWIQTDIPFTQKGDEIEFIVYGFTAYGGGLPSSSNVTIWDSSDPENDTITIYSGTNTFFFSNYTNSTGELTINFTNSYCEISFNLTGTYDTPIKMDFNNASLLYEYNRTFNTKGSYVFNISCSDTVYSAEETNDTFVVSNTAPVITQNTGGFITPPWECYENSVCNYNLSENITDPDTNDLLNYSYAAGTILSCFNIDFDTGNMTLNCKIESETGSVDTILIVSDSDSATDSATLNITVYPVNDTPVFTTIGTQVLTEDVLYSYTVSGSDEEDDIFSYEDNTTLFDINTATGLISFTPTNAEVGEHWVNISINDSLGCYSEIVNFTVLNVNDAPIFDVICDNQTLTEDIPFNCTINASDPDENALTFSVNETWLSINSTGYMNLTPSDENVGEHWLNISVSDASLIDSAIINWSIINVEDLPVITTAENISGYENITWYYDFNATDGDLDIPGTTEILTWNANETFLNINSLTGIASFTPNTTQVGENWVNISVNDSIGNMDSVIINITIKSNNIPAFTPNSEFFLTEDIEFYFNFTDNVTDPDNDILFFYSNNSLFDINETLGTINITLNDSAVGENWVNISIKDTPGYYVSGIINFTVINVNDNPNITTRDNETIYENNLFYYQFNATDEDLEIPSTWESLTWEDDTSLFDIDSSTGLVSFTPENESLEGNYSINITVRDTTGLTDEWILNLTILRVNDNPNITSTDSITGYQDSPISYEVNATDEEEDPTGIKNGSLTFRTNTTWANFVIDPTTGIISFTPNSSQVGENYLNITVNDTQGLEGSRIVVVNVSDVNDPVTVTLGTPGSNRADIIENNSQTFTIYVNDPDTGQILTYNWYLDLVLNSTVSTATQSNAFTFYANYTDEGEHNMSVVVSDGVYEATYYWNLTINNTNAPPEFYKDIENISFNQDTSYSLLDLDNNFLDYDSEDSRYNQTMNFSFIRYNETLSEINGTSNTDINISISNNTNIVTITPRSSWTGYEILEFFLIDEEFEAVSNNFSINITPAELPVVEVPGGGGGGGGGGGATQYTTIDILHPGDVSLYSGEKIITPIIVRNSGTTILSNIKLEAKASTSDLILNLDKIDIPSLAPGKEEEVNLEIITGADTKEGKRDITVSAVVGSPSVTDSIKFFVNLLEFGIEDKQLVKEKLKYLKDMINENPECLELTEFMDKAETEMATGRFSQALELTRLGMQGCKDLVASLKEQEKQKPSSLSGENLPLFLLEIVALIIVLLIGYRLYKRRISHK
ncbi:MAG: Ig-like domain-containing protein [Candidatus Nanoarchaeia archaeon]|nr:Ig-like domain-containing protein [Candidatus Nanoarchaeia archaeon]